MTWGSVHYRKTHFRQLSAGLSIHSLLPTYGVLSTGSSLDVAACNVHAMIRIIDDDVIIPVALSPLHLIMRDASLYDIYYMR